MVDERRRTRHRRHTAPIHLRHGVVAGVQEVVGARQQRVAARAYLILIGRQRGLADGATARQGHAEQAL